ncbi:MAG: EAL domain-containing protein [Campylobacterales bacterium]|nr:EAL domain-containing protein [Campylobacterales bacterium]
MYHAKQSGKNRFHFFDTEYDKALRSRHESIENIKQALAQDQFVLYYQPKVNMLTGRVIGVEALIRWDHPKKGILPPGDFLPVIDNHILIVELGNWVIKNGIEQIQVCQEMGEDITISVNVHALQLHQHNFLNTLTELLEQYPEAKNGSLEFEILETSALENIGYIADIIQICKALGINFSLDDFKTSYSSLTYLKQLPINTMKIDSSFVIDMLHDPDDLAIVKGIIDLSKTFNKSVIAEGVETIEHGQRLVSLGCELAQGHAIAKPMPAEELKKWMKDWQAPESWTRYNNN